jgi:hypothetical protein
MQYLGFIEQSTEIKMQILLDITMLNKAQQIKKITLIILCMSPIHPIIQHQIHAFWWIDKMNILK